MSLHNAVDTVAFVSNGVFTETYGVGEEANLANLFAFYGLIEDAPTGIADYFRKIFMSKIGFSSLMGSTPRKHGRRR